MSIFVENAARHAPEKDDMPAVFHAAQVGANATAGATRQRVVGQPLAAGFKTVEITQGLVCAPRAESIGADSRQACFGKASFFESRCRTRLKEFPFATPLASPSSIEVRSAASLASNRRSSRSNVRSAERTTSLEFS